MSDAVKPTAPTARATIYDLGYKRYAGGRRPQSTRWRVISRNQLAQAWKTWWRFKAWIAFAVLITVVLGAVMVLSQKEEFTPLRRSGVIIKMIDGLVFGSGSFYIKVCFLLSLTVGAGVVATDMRSGAFTFYFARPVRAMDYILGKLAALFVLQACVILVPMIVLTLVRLGLSSNTDELVRNLSYLPKSILVGTMGALAMAGLSLGFSSLLPSPRQSVALWAGYYVLISGMFVGVGAVAKVPELGVVDIAFAVETLAYRLFDVAPSADVPMASLSVTVAALLANVALGVGITYARLRATAHAGIGGGS